MNGLGLIAAAAAFLNIWAGHAAVRKIEAAAPQLWIPQAACLLGGAGLGAASTLTGSRALAAALGISAVMLLWDALELARQEKRVMKGHAPANPLNPRHARILETHPAATTLRPLEREPLNSFVPGKGLR